MPAVDSVILSREKVEAVRRDRLMTVGELIARSKTSLRTAWRARTEQPVGLPSARKIARALGVSVKSLLADAADQLETSPVQRDRDGENPWSCLSGGMDGENAKRTNRDLTGQ